MSPRPVRRRSSWAPILALALLPAAGILAACTVTGLPVAESVKRVVEDAGPPVADRADAVRQVFGDLGRAAGMDLSRVFVAPVKTGLVNTASYGDRHLLVALPLWTLGDRCLTWGLAAHEMAHMSLRHGERIMFATSQSGAATRIVEALRPDPNTLPDEGWPVDVAYTRDEETAADEAAPRLLDGAGGPRWALRYAIEFVRDTYAGSDDGGQSWLATHPGLSQHLAGQPPLDVTAVSRLCPTPETRAEHVASLKAWLGPWVRRRADSVERTIRERDRR